MVSIVSLALGGLAGTFARYFLSTLVHRVFGNHFPYGTMLVNVVGCFIIGFLADLTEHRLILGMNARLLLIVGFCGAFTTFSSFILETSHLIHEGKTTLALLNVLAGVTVGFIAFRLGILLAETF